MRNQQRNSILERIDKLETLLQELRLEVASDGETTSVPLDTPGPLQVGEQVVIRNPNRNQPKQGVLHKVHHRTRRGTVKAINSRGQEVTIVRLLSNLRRPTEP